MTSVFYCFLFCFHVRYLSFSFLFGIYQFFTCLVFMFPVCLIAINYFNLCHVSHLLFIPCLSLMDGPVLPFVFVQSSGCWSTYFAVWCSAFFPFRSSLSLAFIRSKLNLVPVMCKAPPPFFFFLFVIKFMYMIHLNCLCLRAGHGNSHSYNKQKTLKRLLWQCLVAMKNNNESFLVLIVKIW